MDRRTFLAAGAAVAVTRSAAAQPPASPSPAERVRAAARDARQRLPFDGRRYSGPAYDWLVAKGRQARFFALGEEHGIAENPKLAAQLFHDLVPAGYRHAAIEISPPMATELDRAAMAGMPELRRFLTAPGRQVAFFGMREEAEWLAAARAAVPGRTPVLWGTDYEVFADRHLISMLKATRKPTAAEAALARVEQASAEAWARQASTGDLLQIYPFSGDPEPVRMLRAAWPNVGPDTRWIIDTLEETLEINALFRSRQGYASNARRAAFLRRNFLRHWQRVSNASNPPRVFLKFGSNHLVRGLNGVSTFDMGALIAEIAVGRGERSFHLLVLPGNDSRAAVFDPRSLIYRPNAPKDGYQKGLAWMIDEAWPDAFTLFDTHRLRPAVYSARTADPELVRAIFGYDAVLVMSGSTPSSNL